MKKPTKLNGKNTVSDLMIRKCYNGEYVKVDWLTYFYIWESTTRTGYTYENMQLDAFYCMHNVINSTALHYWKVNNNEMYIPIKDTILKFDFETKTLLIKTNSKNYQCRIADFISTLIEMSE